MSVSKTVNKGNLRKSGKQLTHCSYTNSYLLNCYHLNLLSRLKCLFFQSVLLTAIIFCVHDGALMIKQWNLTERYICTHDQNV